MKIIIYYAFFSIMIFGCLSAEYTKESIKKNESQEIKIINQDYIIRNKTDTMNIINSLQNEKYSLDIKLLNKKLSDESLFDIIKSDNYEITEISNEWKKEISMNKIMFYTKYNDNESAIKMWLYMNDIINLRRNLSIVVDVLNKEYGEPLRHGLFNNGLGEEYVWELEKTILSLNIIYSDLFFNFMIVNEVYINGRFYKGIYNK